MFATKLEFKKQRPEHVSYSKNTKQKMWKSPQKPQHGLTLSMRIELQFTSNKSLRGDNSHKSEETICLSLSLSALSDLRLSIVICFGNKYPKLHKMKTNILYTQASRCSFKRNFLIVSGLNIVYLRIQIDSSITDPSKLYNQETLKYNWE